MAAILTVRDTSGIIKEVTEMTRGEVEKAIQDEFPKLVLSAIRIHRHYLQNETDTSKQAIAEKILKLVADEKFWNALKAIKTQHEKKKKDDKVTWDKSEPTEVEEK